MSLRKIFYALPPSLRLFARKIVFLPLDLISQGYYENGIKVPPRSEIFTGGGDFKETGFRFLGYFKKYGALHPTSKVLDIGSGMGRMAIPLTHFLNDEGHYYGIDIMERGVNRCKMNITSKYENFEFYHLDLQNDLYKNNGADSTSMEVPLKNETIDFVLLISVFTHMLPQEIEHYLQEMHRCMKPGGSCLATFFFYEDEKTLYDNSFEKFHRQDERYALMSEKVQSANVAYSLDYLRNLISTSGFVLKYMSQGAWKGTANAEDFQDFVVLKKS